MSAFDKPAQFRLFAEQALKFYRTVAGDPNAEICASGEDIYEGAKLAVLGAIRLAYPDINEEDIYDIAIDSGESVAYCADYVRQNGQITLKR